MQRMNSPFSSLLHQNNLRKTNSENAFAKSRRRPVSVTESVSYEVEGQEEEVEEVVEKQNKPPQTRRGEGGREEMSKTETIFSKIAVIVLWPLSCICEGKTEKFVCFLCVDQIQNTDII